MIFCANFKLYFTKSTLSQWVNDFTHVISRTQLQSHTIIVAPSTPLLFPFYQELRETSFGSDISIAAQDISPYTAGAHTGEAGAFQIADEVKYVIIGHSERRADGEKTAQIAEKITRAHEVGMTAFVCFSTVKEYSDLSKLVDLSKCTIVYEPVESISSNPNAKPAEPESVQRFADTIKISSVIYGGSVDSVTVKSYCSLECVDGFLIGKASRDPYEFAKIISAVSR